MKRVAINLPSIPILFLLGAALLLLPGCANLPDLQRQASPPCIGTGWPQDNSDLTPDPALDFGQLANGLRYIIMENREPENRVGLYLLIQAGSLNETDEQRGVAHFLEHMLFNGTTHFPPGTLVEYFQSIGMGFGNDTNASTSFGETVYNLFLPSGETGVMDEGFRVLADYARGALLLEQEVDRERGIILAERRSRDSAWSRVGKQQLRFQFAGTLAAERDPIGTEEVLREADSALLRSYYDTWYRPDNMIVVVVGEMESDQARLLIEKHFSPLQNPGLEADCPRFGGVKETGTDILYLHEPDIGHTRISLGTVFNLEPQPATLAWETEQLKKYLVNTMLANRLDKLANQADSPAAATKARAGSFLQRVGYANLSAETAATEWKQALSLLQTTLYQTLEYGFSPAEFERVKRELNAYLEKEARTAGSRDTRELARSILWKLGNDEVILSPSQEETLYTGLMDTMTLAELNRTMAELWQHPRRLVTVVGSAEVPEAEITPEEHIHRIYLANLEAYEQEGTPWSAAEATVFPYLPLPQAGRVIDKVVHQGIGAATYVLSNNVRLHLKQTEFEENELLLTVHFGGGKLSQPKDGLAMVAESVIRESGVGGLTNEQLEEALAGTSAGLAFQIGVESFSFNGRGLSDELELLLQLVYAKLYDPAFRPEAMRRSQRYFERMYRRMVHSVEGRQQLSGERFLAGGSPLYGFASQEQVAGVTLEQIEQWLRPLFSQAALEFTIVGDIDEQTVLSLVTRYFGGTKRQGANLPVAKPVTFPAGTTSEYGVDSAIDKALLTVAWQTEDFWDISRTRRLNVLATVFGDRLRMKIREELGATYSPEVGNHSSRVLPGFGLLRCQLTVDPAQAEMLVQVILDTAAHLASNGVTREELTRALQPTLTAIRDYRRTNNYWVRSVLALSGRYPLQLQWPLTLLDDFDSIRPEELNQLARQYLQTHLAAVTAVVPEH